MSDYHVVYETSLILGERFNEELSRMYILLLSKLFSNLLNTKPLNLSWNITISTTVDILVYMFHGG